MNPKVTKELIESKIKDVEIVTHISRSGQILRWAVITMENGFAVTGNPSCAVDPMNDDITMGSAIAIENAKANIWALEGYLLKNKMQTH